MNRDVKHYRIADLAIEVVDSSSCSMPRGMEAYADLRRGDAPSDIKCPSDLRRQFYTDRGYDSDPSGSALLFEVAEQLPRFNRILFHGAAITYGGKAYLFGAPSGTGKSTHIALWKRCLGQRVDIVCGDKPILYIGDSCGAERGSVTVFGTPWGGKEGWQKNTSAPLGALCFIERGAQNEVSRLDQSEALDRTLRQVYIPQDSVVVGRTLELVNLLMLSVPIYKLKCDVSREAVECCFNAVTGDDFIAQVPNGCGER